MVEEASNAVSALCPDSHWQRFFQLFGELVMLERVLSEPGRAVLLAMYEALAGRCLFCESQDWNPVFPVLCTLRDYDVLKAQLCRGERVQDDEAAFVLRRLDGDRAPEWPSPSPPEVLLVTTSMPAAVCGRDGPLALRLVHVSKAHAVLRLFRDTSSIPATWKLTIQDTSTNGTWVNGVKLMHNTQQELKLHDQVCFVPPAPASRQLIYQVLPGSMHHSGLLQRPAAISAPADIVERVPSMPPPSSVPSHATARTARPSKRQRLQDECLSTWLASLGDPAVLQYEHQLLRLARSASDLRDHYASDISRFVAELGVREEHKATFRRGLLQLRHAS
ncbi:unnamed protein product [Symbiodinium pilosum]|uniref:FHA domain-containing protein n=1 Tax=Symbiodinium pilosum TaxID=2952 RepID=A0A812TDC2_SYMPI|nr:unnamed protein product [Symbiodinium pilosum]